MQKPDVKVVHNNNDSPSQQPLLLTFYPAWSFKASETWSKWVKLTAHDIHHVLKPHEKYSETTTTLTDHLGRGHHRRRDAPLLLFYLNHPIQFVQVVGVVVAFDEYYEKFWLLTIDDSSGATLEVTCPKPEKEKEKQKQMTGGGGGGGGVGLSNATNKNAGDERTTNHDQQQDEEGEEEVLHLHRTIPTLTIGTVVQAKGTLSTFRSCRQLSLLRLNVVADTTHEMALIASRTSFLTTTLSKPWIVTPTELQSLRSEAEGEKVQETQRAHRRRQREIKKRRREERHAQVIAKAYERDEGHRAKAADEARIAGEALRAL